MPETRVFVNTALFDRWISAGSVDLDGGRVRARATGASYSIEEAVHVIAEVSGGGDASGLVDRVTPVTALLPLGAELLDRSMVIGELAYDVVPGFLLAPLGRSPAGEALAALSLLAVTPGATEPPSSDEELLARYLIEKLE